MKSIPLKLPDVLLARGGPIADELLVRRAEKLAELSRRVREESMRVNAEFDSIERDPDA